MLSILTLGFLIGMRHTLEADHVAAVATLTARAGSVRRAVPLGLMWGLGHTLALGGFGMAALLLGAALPQSLAGFLELAVGVMLVALGTDVLVRLIRDRIHFHVHRHHDGVVHFHAHSHAGDPNPGEPHKDLRNAPAHRHCHSAGLRVRAFFIGIMHGMAGSAVLIVLTMQSLPSLAAGMTYIALFGMGSILGMTVLTAAIAWPLHRWGQTLTWLNNTARAGVGGLTIVLGVVIVFEHWSVF
ncbi:MAG: urease accessory protein [Rhodospirillales bacterium]|nr:urease accessory protein [Alphaproteobacteria bacterium]MBL6948025.1 urease accessory protein [Rhodospirillales bacterium]